MQNAIKLIGVLVVSLLLITLGVTGWQARYIQEFFQGSVQSADPALAQEMIRTFGILGLLALLLQILAITVVTYIFMNVAFLKPVRLMTKWIKSVRLGEWSHPGKIRGENTFRTLFKEIKRLAFSLNEARGNAEKEARLRHVAESVWTPDRLKEFVRVRLQNRPMYVVSNREPYEHVWNGKEIKCTLPASGLVTAIEPVLKACGGTWIAQGSGDADREVVDSHDRLRVPPEEPQYGLRRVWVSKEENDGYYLGFANEGIWPLCHIAHTRPVFRMKDWAYYKAVNMRFANAVLEELEGTEEPCVMIQDYHFALLPKLIKDKRPDARITIFWHIPWPNPESFGICPWKNEILEGMLASDIIGFHTQFHCNNFLETVDRFLESRIDYEHFAVHREGGTTWVKPFPISIAFLGEGENGHDESANHLDKQSLLKEHGLEVDFLAVGVDRIDYTKGILERLLSVEHFLERNPRYQGRFTYVELGAPSRSGIAAYQDLAQQLKEQTERINNRFRERTRQGNWQPILLLEKTHPRNEIMSFYRASDLCMVTSLHDGMNLVAKEYVMARDDEKGVLVLSEFTGAAMELKDALIINPYDIAETADAIKKAVEMPLAEQVQRMRQMRETLLDRNIYRWAADLVNELARVRLDAPSDDKAVIKNA